MTTPVALSHHEGALFPGLVTVEVATGQGRLWIPPRALHHAFDWGPDTAQMLSTHLVDVGEPVASFTSDR